MLVDRDVLVPLTAEDDQRDPHEQPEAEGCDREEEMEEVAHGLPFDQVRLRSRLRAEPPPVRAVVLNLGIEGVSPVGARDRCHVLI